MKEPVEQAFHTVRHLGREFLKLLLGLWSRLDIMLRSGFDGASRRSLAGFRIVDALGRTLAYVYTRPDKTGADIAKILVDGDGKVLAERLAMLPVWFPPITD